MSMRRRNVLLARNRVRHSLVPADRSKHRHGDVNSMSGAVRLDFVHRYVGITQEMELEVSLSHLQHERH